MSTARSASSAERFDVAPLRSALGGATIEVLADVLRVSTRQVCRFLHEGLDDVQADRAAIAIGLHPGIVWPEWWRPAVRV